MNLPRTNIYIKFPVIGVCCVLFALLFVSCVTTSDKPKISDIQKAEAHYRFGHSYLQSNDLKKAFVEFQEVIKLNSRDKHALSAIGLIYASPGYKEYEKAIKYLKRAISIDPNFSDAYNHLGVAYSYLNKYEEAIKYFKKALGNPLYLHPESASSNMGYAYYKTGDYISAVRILKEAISKYPDDPRSYYNLGLVYYKIGKVKAAIKEFKRVLKIAPGYTAVHWEIANAYMREGNNLKATEYFQKFTEGSQDDEKTRKALEYIDLLNE